MPCLDAIVCGSVAVTRDGRRCGKGEGYSDLEFAILRAIWRGSEEVRFATDSPLEGAVSSEPVSESGNFPASWEYTANFIDSKAQPHTHRGEKASKSVSYGPIPYAS